MKRLLILFVLLLLASGAYCLYQLWPDDDLTPLPLRTTPKIATWVGVQWVMQAQDEMAIADLAEGLSALRVSDAFVYVSYLRPEGMFNPTYDHAAAFTRTFRRYAPDIQLYAWVDVPVRMTDAQGGEIANRLAQADTRQQIADFALRSVQEMGFDGVHLNAEPIPNGDAAFLQLLELLRNTLPAERPLSTTSHALRVPVGTISFPYPRLTEQATQDYLAQIMARVDQVALMAYDSGLPGPRDYRDWVQYQTWTAAAAAHGQMVQILIGLPTSEEWTPSHQRAETIVQALTGFQAGFHPRIDGVAIYPFWEMSSAEWWQLHRALGVDSIYNEP